MKSPHGNQVWYDVHEGFVGFFIGRGLTPPPISKHAMQFTQEEFERFAAECAESEHRNLKFVSMANEHKTQKN